MKRLLSCLAILLLSSQLMATTIVTMAVYGPMVYNKQTIENLKKIDSLKQGDVVILEINSPGGLMDVYEEYVAIAKYRGVRLVSRVDAGNLAASAAALLVCSSDSRLISNQAVLMFHMPYYKIEFAGKTVLRVGATGNQFNYFYQLFPHRCGDLLTKSNLETILSGEDLWVIGAQVNALKTH